jgi:two-component system, sensor histidine kinase LadS
MSIRILVRLFFTLLCMLSLHSIAATRATPEMQFWIDRQGTAQVEDVAKLAPSSLVPLEGAKAQQLSASSAMWLRYELPERSGQLDWYLKLEGPPFINRVSLYERNAAGQWVGQTAGDHVPNAQWARPGISPNFKLMPSTQGVVWLRIQEFPSPSRPALTLIDENEYRAVQMRGLLLIGCYFGFCLIVLYLGVVYWRLHRDNIFVAYVAYVACMMGLQLCFTGVGQAVFWRNAASWNDVIVAFFATWVVAAGAWFTRQMVALARHSPRLEKFVKAWCYFGFVFPLVYAMSIGPVTLGIVNLYGVFSVLLSLGITLWAWRQGEAYGKWTALAFLPLHVAYVFPGLRLAGVMEDGFATQFAFLIGSSIEIPALLYLLHRRAKEYGENSARLQSVRTSDALTGLPILPVLEVRLGDAMARAQRQGTQCAFLIVELQNYAQIVAAEGHLGGERALVMMASRLQRSVSSIDTVCRLSDTRMAVVLEPPVSALRANESAQSMVTKGLMRLTPNPQELAQVYCIGYMLLPFTGADSDEPQRSVPDLLTLVQTELDKVPVASSRKIFKFPLSERDLLAFDDSVKRAARQAKPTQPS